MFKSLVAAAAGLLILPAVAYADAPPVVHFFNGGVDYSYTTQIDGQTEIVRGSARNGLEPFELRVSKTDVTGTFNGQDVDFPRGDKQTASTELFAVH